MIGFCKKKMCGAIFVSLSLASTFLTPSPWPFHPLSLLSKLLKGLEFQQGDCKATQGRLNFTKQTEPTGHKLGLPGISKDHSLLEINKCMYIPFPCRTPPLGWGIKTFPWGYIIMLKAGWKQWYINGIFKLCVWVQYTYKGNFKSQNYCCFLTSIFSNTEIAFEDQKYRNTG